MANIWEKHFLGPTSSRRLCCFSPHATNLLLAGLLLTIWSGCGIIIQVEIKRSSIRKQIDGTWPTVLPSVLSWDKDQWCDWLAQSSQSRRLASRVTKCAEWKANFSWTLAESPALNFFYFSKQGLNSTAAFSLAQRCVQMSVRNLQMYYRFLFYSFSILSLLSHYISKWIVLTEDEIIHAKSSNVIKTTGCLEYSSVY